MNFLSSKQKLSITNKEIWQISYPIVFGNLAQTLIVFVDTVFIGHVGNIELGAVMLAGIYYWVFTALAQGFAIGVQIIIARKLGAEEHKRVGEVFEHGLLFTVILGLTLWLTMHFTSNALLNFIIDSPAVYEAARQFDAYRHYGIIIVCLNYLFRALYIGLSNTKIITYTTILMAAVNIFLDYCMIFGNCGFPEMGVGGAALASVCAEISALLLFVGYTFLKIPYKKYAIFCFSKIKTSLLKHVLKLAFPTMLQRLMSFGLWFIFFAMIEHTGEEPIAISGIVRSVYLLTSLPIFAFAATANTLTSRLIGAKKEFEVEATLRQVLKICYLVIVPIVIICACVPEYIARIYTDDMQLAINSVSTIYIILIATLTLAPAMVYFEFVSGTGNTLSALFLEGGVLVVYIIYLYITTTVFNLPVETIWTAEILYGGLLFPVSYCFLKFAKWRKKD